MAQVAATAERNDPSLPPPPMTFDEADEDLLDLANEMAQGGFGHGGRSHPTPEEFGVDFGSASEPESGYEEDLDTDGPEVGQEPPGPTDEDSASDKPCSHKKPKKTTTRRKPGAPPTPRVKAPKPKLGETDPGRGGARLSIPAKVRYLEDVMRSDAVPSPTRMKALEMHNRFTGDLLEKESAPGEDEQMPQLDPAQLMTMLSRYSGLEPELFLRDLGGISHVLSVFIEIGRIHPHEIAKAAMDMVDDEGNVVLPPLPLVDAESIPGHADSK